MPTPPSRGIGVLWTSRSRTAVKAPVATARLRTKGVARYVTAAATMRTRTYSCTYRPSLGRRRWRVGLTQRGYAGKRVTRSVTSARTSLLTAWSGSASPCGDGLVDERGDLLHLLQAHALGRDRRRADPDARGDVGLLRVEGDGVLVEHDAGRVGPLLGLLAGDADALEVEQRQVGVGAARRRADAELEQARRELLAVGDDVLGVLGVLGGRGLLEVDRLGRDGVHLRAALHHREDRLVHGRGVLGLADEGAGARAAQHLVRREGDDVGVRARATGSPCRPRDR